LNKDDRVAGTFGDQNHRRMSMKRISGSLLALTMMLAIQVQVAQAVEQKYDIKSGIVTMGSVMKMGKFVTTTKVVVYFDDYGMKECKETYEDGKLTEVYFSDGKTLYTVKPDKKTAFKTGEASRGTELRVEFTEMGTQKDRDSGKIKKLPSMLIVGKPCEAFEMNDGSGTVTTYAGWKKIMVYMKSSSASMTTTVKASKIEENVAVPATKFQVPAGYKVQ
jgi:outer membrane lipoprotein-sorting protein